MLRPQEKPGAQREGGGELGLCERGRGHGGFAPCPLKELWPDLAPQSLDLVP